MKPEILAMYLPQFHRIPENDAWWGEGFTEWTAVKSASPLFENHRQPVIPRDGNYYDLLSKETMEWQVDLMNKYDIFGLCIYHYWFRDGKKILERPAENLLAWKDLQTNYCFCWANESWARTWSNFGYSNVWAASFEMKSNYAGSGLLLEQQYGNSESWKEHFEYLLPFFEDNRYIKYQNKPVFVIYRPELILCLADMKQLWDRLAIEAGFEGIYFVLANCNESARELADLELVQEPKNTVRNGCLKKISGIQIEKPYDYDEAIEYSLSYISRNPNVSYGGFVRYDDTPRRGRNGILFNGGTPEKFETYMQKLLAKNEDCGSPWVFLNAWNEWGEGMYLEPDEQYGEAYLEALKKAQGEYRRYCGNYQHIWESKECKEIELAANELTINTLKGQLIKSQKQAEILHYWLLKKEMQRSFAAYLLSFGYKHVAVYGVGILGRHLISELANTEILVEYAIDMREDAKANSDIDVVRINDIKDNVDVIIVTVPHIYREICEEIRKYSNVKTISLEQIVMEC